MEELLTNPGVVAAIGTVVGGISIKMIDHWLGKARVRAAEEAVKKEEHRKEIESLRLQLEKADAEEQRLIGLLDDWKNKYYDLRDEKQKVLTELTIATERLKELEKTIGRG